MAVSFLAGDHVEKEIVAYGFHHPFGFGYRQEMKSHDGALRGAALCPQGNRLSPQ